MSNIYIQEPPCSGKVLLITTVGEIDIELWSKEAPKACRNFVQLCLENYYNGTVFHRVIKGFIAQGGDPKGDGTGGKSIYDASFKDEFHSRLRFVRRGLVAVAGSEKDGNGSQFFFTLGPSPELQNKHTIFGKVTGDTLYNMLKLEDCDVDENDKPLYPHKIISTRVLLNPFPDIVPRVKGESKSSQSTVESKKKGKKDFKLLSFGEEAEEEELEISAVTEKYKGKSKSSHDLTNDPKLSSISVATLYQSDIGNTATQVENVRKKLSKPVETVDQTKQNTVLEDINPEKDENRRKQIQKEIKELKKDLRKRKADSMNEKEMLDKGDIEEDVLDSENPLLMDFHKQSIAYRKKNKTILCSSDERSKKTMELLESFTKKMKDLREEEESDDEEQSEKRQNKDSWLLHQMNCEETVPLAKDANLPSEERYELSDPRNPMNIRRRQGSKKSK